MGKAQALGDARQLSGRRLLASPPLSKRLVDKRLVDKCVVDKRVVDRRDNSKILKNSVQSLAKGFRVLEAFSSDQGELTLSEIAEATALDAGTTFRMLNCPSSEILRHRAA